MRYTKVTIIAAAWLAGAGTTAASPGGDAGGDEPAVAEAAPEHELLEREVAIVWFGFDSARLTRSARKTLDEISAQLLAQPDAILVIEGHTCSIGTDQYNADLGERRAAGVRSYLEAKGVDADRVRVVSHGEDDSISATKPFNRRVVIRPAVIPKPVPEPEPIVTMVVGPPKIEEPVPPPPVKEPEPVGPAPAPVFEEEVPAGTSVGVGGGVVGFLDAETRDYSDPGGLWEVRVAYGTRKRIALEAAYNGSAQNIDALGLDSGAVLVGHGIEGAVRLNLLANRAWQPYGFAGLGYTYYSVENADFNTSDVRDHEDTLRIPFGLGLGYRLGAIRVDVRGTIRQSMENDRGLTGGVIAAEAASFSNWSADMKLGWEF